MFARYSSLLILVGFFSAASALAQSPSDDPVAWAAEVQKLAGEWTPVAGYHCGKDLTKDQLGKIKFGSGKGGYGISLAPVIPAGNWPTSYLCNVRPAGKQLIFTRNVGIKGIAYYGIYEVQGDTLRIGFDLVPWERSSADPSFAKGAPRAFPKDKDRPGGPSTVFTFKRAKK